MKDVIMGLSSIAEAVSTLSRERVVLSWQVGACDAF